MDNFNSDFTPGADNTEIYSDTGSSAPGSKMNEVKEKASQQAVAIKEKVAEKTRVYGTQMKEKVDQTRGKAAGGLRTTSERINNLALYLEEHDAQDMSEAVARNSKELVRKNPGKSLIAGLVVGLLIGRIFSMGGGHHHHSHQR